MQINPPLNVAIIGSGFGGLAIAWHLKQAGVEAFTLFEKAETLGGVWRENTYPGAACDVASHLYSFSFETNYPWTHRFSRQETILGYLQHCAQKYGLDQHIRFSAEVTSLEFDESRRLWTLTLVNGEQVEARSVVSAVGQLHRPLLPVIPGLSSFRGRAFHSAHWDHSADLDGKAVAVIGTGASAVQFVPAIAPRVGKMFVFQRSPGWVISRFQWAFTGLERWLFRNLPFLRWVDRQRIHWFLEFVGYSYQGHKWAERIVTAAVKATLWLQVRNRALRKKLTPDFPVGCKRILVSSNWLPTLSRSNVELVTDRVVEVTADGVRTADNQVRQVDTIVFGTGFTATEFLAPMRVRGADGKDLHSSWQEGADAYLGMAVAGFPNFFLMYGPNTNVGSGSVVFMLECQARYITRLVLLTQQEGSRRIEVRQDAQAAFREEMTARSAGTTFLGNCQSWNKTAGGRNTNNWIGLMGEYRRRTAAPDLSHYHLT